MITELNLLFFEIVDTTKGIAILKEIKFIDDLNKINKKKGSTKSVLLYWNNKDNSKLV